MPEKAFRRRGQFLFTLRPRIETGAWIVMAGRIPQVVVVGGGILGACIAWHLARRRVQVTLVERHDRLALGVSANSYGWVGTGSRLPSEQPASFALEQQALGEFPRLAEALGALPVAAQGALIWLDSEQETLAMLAEQQAAGVRMSLVGRSAIGELEPGLVQPPEVAIWAPDDFAVEPDLLARQLMAAALSEGAVLRTGSEVLGLRMQGARVTGVQTDTDILPADVVVLANAMGAQALARALDVTLPIHEAPAVLLRLDSARAPLRHLLYGHGLEVRPGLGGGLLSAADYPADDALSALGQACCRSIAELFAPSCAVSLRSLHAVQRPKTDDGLPLRRFLPGFSGLYVTVAHPGVILAPLLGRLASEEIVGEWL